ncbi:MAG: hypothetical protein PHN49_00200 [Candidatus Omnitrophica bacterium]|nr:hypothetical protein [Candidatus Omnitrophota bacterium]
MNEKQDQIDFCKNSLQNIQNLIARMDLKAGIILTIVGLLSPAIYPFAIALFENCIHMVVRIGLGLILAVYFIFLALLLWAIRNVFIARPASVGNYAQAPQMLFPQLILKTYKSDKDFKEKATQLTHDDIVADYSNQIMECSFIYELKHNYVNKAIKWLLCLLIPWVLFLMVSSGYLLCLGKNCKNGQAEVGLEKKSLAALPINNKSIKES